MNDFPVNGSVPLGIVIGRIFFASDMPHRVEEPLVQTSLKMWVSCHKHYSRPSSTAVLLFVVSVTRGQLCSDNIKSKIPEMTTYKF